MGGHADYWELIKLGLWIIISICVYVMIWRRRRRLRGNWLIEDTTQFRERRPDELVTIGRFRNYLDAEVRRLRLESLGIKSAVFGEMLTTVQGAALSAPVIVPVELRVRAEDAEKALVALQGNETSAEPSPDSQL